MEAPWARPPLHARAFPPPRTPRHIPAPPTSVPGLEVSMDTFRRSRSDRLIAGVCGGLARSFDMDPTLVRVLYVGLSVISAAFPGMLVYAILWFFIPED